jgi:hypothetical protein
VSTVNDTVLEIGTRVPATGDCVTTVPVEAGRVEDDGSTTTVRLIS